MDTQTITPAFYRGDKYFTVEQTTANPLAKGEGAERIVYCGVCGTDMHVYHGNMDANIGHNRILGHEMTGVNAMAVDGGWMGC